MYFSRVEISQFRNLASTSFTPSPGLNLFCGANGSGKSSLLEAIHYTLTSTSFRTNRLSTLIQYNHDCFTLFARLHGSADHKLGIRRCRNLDHQTRLDGADIAKRSELVHLAPLQIISPESINLLLDGSEHRRNYLDWALFHVEHSFHYHLSHYLRTLRQRNAQLKSASPNLLEQWDILLIEHGEVIDRLRRGLVEPLGTIVIRLLSKLLPELDISLAYRTGWASGMTLQEALVQARDNDIRNHHTTVGPHRGDLILRSTGIKVTDALSRGQLKLVMVALKLAQTLLLQNFTNKKPIILIDDMAAELDVEHRGLLFDTLRSAATQLFITTPDISLIPNNEWSDRKVFHVEHGKIKEVV